MHCPNHIGIKLLEIGLNMYEKVIERRITEQVKLPIWFQGRERCKGCGVHIETGAGEDIGRKQQEIPNLRGSEKKLLKDYQERLFTGV